MLSRLTLLLITIVLPGMLPAQDVSKPERFAGTGNSVKPSAPYESGSPSGPPVKIPMGNPFGVEIVGTNVWLTTVDDHCIWQTTVDGKELIRVAGSGQIGYEGDGGSALEAKFNWPHEVRSDPQGNLYVADTRNHVIRRIDAQSGIVTTVAGSGEPGFSGEGKSGTQVRFKQPHSVVLDHRGGLLVADTQNHRIRRIDLKSGNVITFCGTGRREMPIDGGHIEDVSLFGPRSLAVDEDSIWIALREGNSIWRIDRTERTIHHVAGTGKKGYSGDGGDPAAATFSGPKGITVDDRGRLLVVDTENHAIRRIDLSANRIETVLGGTNSEATDTLRRPHGIAQHPKRGFFVADSENHRVLIGH